jgi:hypothetical protein
MSYSYDTSHDSPNYTPEAQARSVFGQPRVIKGITIHHWGDPSTNPTFEGVRDYLCRKNGNTSAHVVVTGTGRRAACIVNYNDVAWHSGSAWGNARTIGLELDPRARDEDYDVAAEVVADIRSAFGDVPIYWHSYFTATACPGKWDPARLDELSYKKYSAAEWGKGGWKAEYDPTKVAQPTVPAPTPVPVPEPTPEQQVPSPTATPEQGGGLPVTEKPDYSEENNNLLKQILAIVKSILDKLTSIFK